MCVSRATLVIYLSDPRTISNTASTTIDSIYITDSVILRRPELIVTTQLVWHTTAVPTIKDCQFLCLFCLLARLYLFKKKKKVILLK